MSQSRTWSLVETITNVIIGYWIVVAGQTVIYPLFGLKVSLAANMQIAGVFMVIGIARGFLLRRLFNWWQR